MPVKGRLLLLSLASFCTCALAALPHFPADAVWQRDISKAPLAEDSEEMIRSLEELGGWGSGDDFQIDFAITVLHADPGSPTKPLVASEEGYYEGECEDPGFAFPLPEGGAIEESDGYVCEGGDCHLLVWQGNRLFESYHTSLTERGLESMCAVIWELDRVYGEAGRGEHCTSADAAGFPIAPLLLEADEVAAASANDGDLGHAIRFILPNSRMAAGVYVRPASHAGSPSGPSSTVPYGARLRLRPDFPMTGYNDAERAILRTMQRYGIVLADGGNIALTAASDRFSKVKWEDLGIDAHSFVRSGGVPVKVSDFDVLDTGPRIPKNGDCRRVSN